MSIGRSDPVQRDSCRDPAHDRCLFTGSCRDDPHAAGDAAKSLARVISLRTAATRSDPNDPDSALTMRSDSAPIRRLTNYWKIEAGNAALIPAIAVYFVLRSGATITPALVLSGLACSFLLVIGTIVLRMMLRRARGEPDATKGRIALLAWMRWPAIGLCVAAAVALGAQCIADGVQLDARFVAPAILLLLAVLEYINYYHFQLQHFDHAPDWQRLVSGRGFRRSHLAREIDRWKRERRGA